MLRKRRLGTPHLMRPQRPWWLHTKVHWQRTLNLTMHPPNRTSCLQATPHHSTTVRSVRSLTISMNWRENTITTVCSLTVQCLTSECANIHAPSAHKTRERDFPHRHIHDVLCCDHKFPTPTFSLTALTLFNLLSRSAKQRTILKFTTTSLAILLATEPLLCISCCPIIGGPLAS